MANIHMCKFRFIAIASDKFFNKKWGDFINNFKSEYVLRTDFGCAFEIGQYVLVELDGLTDDGGYKDNYCGEIKSISQDSVLIVSDKKEKRGREGRVAICEIKSITKVYRPDEKYCGGYSEHNDDFTPSFGIYCKDDIEQNTW